MEVVYHFPRGQGRVANMPSSKSKRQDVGSRYHLLPDNLIKFHELGLLGTLELERLNEGQGIEAAMVANNAQHHHTCRLKHSYTELQRAKKNKKNNEYSRQKGRVEIYQLQRSAPDHFHPIKEGAYGPRSLFSSADNLLGLKVFMKQLHFK